MEFNDVKFMSAEEKRLVLRDWDRFLKTLMKCPTPSEKDRARALRAFTKRLYRHLHLHCSFIAHFDREGFFYTYFANPGSTLRFLRQFDKDSDCRAVEYGSSWWLNGDFADINQAMCEALEPVKEGLYAKLQEEARQRDVQLATALLAKHGIVVTVQNKQQEVVPA